MRQDLEQAVAVANRTLGYERLRLEWISETNVHLRTIAERSGRRTGYRNFVLPHDLEKALRAIARITENYPSKRNAALAQQK